MAVQYIPNSPSTPVRRSSRHLAPSSTTTPKSRTTSISSSRSRKRSRLPDEPDQKEQDLSVDSFLPRTRLATIIGNRAPLTPEPTPRAIRAQKRRKFADAETEPAIPSDASSSSSPSYSPTTPLPQPISPEPISPTHSLSSPYIVRSRSKSRPNKRKLQDDRASSIASSSSDSPLTGDPLPRSLTKRRKLDRTPSARQKPQRSVRVRSKSKSFITGATPPTPLSTSKKRTTPNLRPGNSGSVPSPRGASNNHPRTKKVRRSARLLVNTTDQPRHQCPYDAQLDESLPLSPLTPPPSDDDSSEYSQLRVTAIEQNAAVPSSLETEAESLVEEEDDSEMEMIACIGLVPTASSSVCWKSIIPSHISNPVLKGRPPPNPALYTQLQLASYRRTKPNTPSPLSLYSYTGITPPTSPALPPATINSLDAIDDIPLLGEAAAVAAIAEDDSVLAEQLFHAQQQPQLQFYGQGYLQVDSPQQQQQSGQEFEQQPQPELASASSSSPPESSTSPPPPLVDVNFMIDLQFQMQLQHIGMQGSTTEGMHFGVDQIGFMIGGNAAEERNEGHPQIPTTVHMQDVHLHQQPHQNQNHIMDAQPNHQLFGYPYFSTEQQGSNQLYGTQGYGAESQSFQGQPEYQQQEAQRQFQNQHQPEYHHQEQPQASSPSSYEAYGGIQAYQSGPSQVYEQRPHQLPQQDFQAQQQHGGDEAPPFSDSNLNIGYDTGAYQTQTQPSPSTSVTPLIIPAVAAPTPVRAATAPIPHYTLSMHNALLFFQQSHSRFHEDQHLLAHDATEIHMRQLEEFQREKEERKRRLKRTKLVKEVQVVPMGSSAAGLASGIGLGASSGVGRTRGLWPVACKARMFEVVRIYTPALIREVTEISAREYYHRMGLKYPPCRFLSWSRRRMRRREDDLSISDDDRDCDLETEGGEVEGDGDDGFDGLSSLEKKEDGDTDGEEFRKEKIFDFELLDDDEEYDEDEVMDEVRKQKEMEDEEMDDEDDEDEDEDGNDGDDEEASGVDLDLEAIRDPFFQPELSMRITPQEPIPSSSGGVETTFYVPPPEMYAVPEQNAVAPCEDQVDSEAQPTSSPSASASNVNSTATATWKQKQNQKFMLFHRPCLPLPPPALSTFRPAALRFYNVDPVHAGRGTPCVKERREVWAGMPLVSSAKQPRRIGDSFASGMTGWYAYADEVRVDVAEDGPSSTSSDTTGPGSDPHSTDDSVFGDCAGTCCMNEKVKGKMKAVEVEEEEGERGGVGEGKLEEELPRGEEEAHGDDDGPSSTSAALPQEPIAQPPPPPPPNRHMTVEIPPAHPDRIPHRRRGVIGRTELLKVYAPPSRSAPSILPVARRPPRPPPPTPPTPTPTSLGLGLGLDETETNSVVSSMTAPPAPPPQTYQHHHHYHDYPVVPYSWEQVAEAMEVLAYQGIDASIWVDGHGHGHGHHPPSPSSNGISSGTKIRIQQQQPSFNPSSSELSAALG